MSESSCTHPTVKCLNQYELIRKYRCDDCGGIVMCACDEQFGHRFLAHQLAEGCELDTQLRIPVTHGFEAAVCSECRGRPADAAPKAAIFGRTSKIKRYYWRELFFDERAAQFEWDEANLAASAEDRAAAYSRIETEVLAQIKREHSIVAKYIFSELNQSEVIEQYNVVVEALIATYAPNGSKGALIIDRGTIISPEIFAVGHYRRLGWAALEIESQPFHALFGVMMWRLIQSPFDVLVRMVSFGDRRTFELSSGGRSVSMPLPADFGSKGYSLRRSEAINAHFVELIAAREGLLAAFDNWVPMSADLRQYLWAHHEKHLDSARKLIEVLPPDAIIAVLRYLIDDYWGRYLGWPDLLLYRPDAFRFVEVKSSSDKLSEEQKRWIRDNHQMLHLPFAIAKIHKAVPQSTRTYS